MDESDDIDSFMNFARDLVDLIPINVQTTHPEKNQPKNSKKSDKPSKKVPEAPKTTRAETGSELKERLQSRLSEFKSAREPKKAFNPAEQAAREQKKQLKRAQKKAKRSRTLEKQKDGQSVPQQRGNQNKTNSLSADNPMRIVRKDENSSDSKIEFNKFNFVTGNEAVASGGKIAAENEKYSDKKKAKLEGKASHKLLKHAEGLQKRMEFLEKTNPEEAKKLKAEHAWEKALAHSEGKKVNDNPDKIKASIKASERRTKKSKDSWKKRDAQVSEKKDEKQRKRSGNLKDRVDKKKARKIESAKRRGRLV